jgi:hypothetical protein
VETRAVQRAEIDGVPVFWADGPEPFAGTLVFRTGFADERFATTGITHLVEHLALWQFGGDQPYTYNGVVEPLLTVFHAEGKPEQVAEFLTKTATALTDLPVDKLDVERRILLTEEASSGSGPFALHHRLRFGATGLGLSYFVDFGLRRIGAEDLGRWTTSRFTRGNCAVWLTGPPPAELRLPLPDGERIRPPDPKFVPYRYPCFLSADYAQVVMSLVAERSAAIAMGLRLATRRLQKKLRYEEGVSYDVRGDGDALDSERGYAFLWADCLEEHAQKVCEGMLAGLRELAEEGPTDDELREDIERFRTELDDPYGIAGPLDEAARRELFGRPQRAVEELIAEDEALRPSEVASALQGALDSLLITAPFGPEAAPAGFSLPNAEHGPDQQDGLVFHEKRPLRERHKRARFVIGDGGFTWWNDGEALTIEAPSLVGVATAPDGYTVLYRECGCSIELDPDQLKDGDAAARAVLERVPPELVVEMER